MDFEEFKRDFERFKIIETEKELDICKNQYEAYIKYLQCDNYFDPHIDSNNDFSNNYEKALFKIFDVLNIVENEIILLIIPSFEGEKKLSIQSIEDKYTLTLKVLEVSFWLQLFDKKDSYNLEMKIFTANIDKKLGDKLFQMLRTAISEAKVEEKTYMSLDGIGYTLTQKVKGELISVKKANPRESSKTSKIINILEDFSNWTETRQDAEILLKLESQIDDFLRNSPKK